MIQLADARGAIAPMPQTDIQARKRRSLSCHGCSKPTPAGTVRCRDCFTAVRRETATDLDQLAGIGEDA